MSERSASSNTGWIDYRKMEIATSLTKRDRIPTLPTIPSDPPTRIAYNRLRVTSYSLAPAVPHSAFSQKLGAATKHRCFLETFLEGLERWRRDRFRLRIVRIDGYQKTPHCDVD
jgi:hypothetical protein